MGLENLISPINVNGVIPNLLETGPMNYLKLFVADDFGTATRIVHAPGEQTS